MQGGIRRGLHIDDDDEGARKPDQYGGFDATRKRGTFQRGLDDMLFGGGPRPPARRPAADKSASQDKPTEAPKVQPPPPPPSSTKPQQSKPLSPAKLQPSKTTGQKVPETVPPAKSTGASNKDTSIIKPSSPSPPSAPIEKIEPSGGTIGIISKPQIEAPKKPENNQPEQQQEPISLEIVHNFGNKNKFNKPGFLRKGKKVAENFKFAEDNVTHNFAVDVVRPFETDRTRQKKLNDFDFHDFQFPAAAVSLGEGQKDKALAWKKPNELAKVVNFGKYVDPNDFKPGSLSGPHFLSALSGIAQLEANTKRLIEDQSTNGNGFYLIRLFVNSVWRYIAVDDLLPFVDGQNGGVTSYEGEFDLQGALIEKAYAKSFGGYDVFAKVQPRENYLRDLTGAPVKRYSIDYPDLQNVIKKALAAGQVVQAVPTEKIGALGANPNFSYSVINFSNKGVELRNSWGTLEERSKITFKPEGNFDLGAGQLRDNISHLLVTSVNSDYFTTTVQSRHRLGFYSTYSFKVRNNTHGFLTVSQWDQRLFPSTGHYQYSPATIILQKENAEGHAEFVNANHSINSRNLDLEVNLTPGNYTVFVAVSWKHEDHSFNLTFFGSEKVDFSRVYNDKDPNSISQSLESVNVDQGKRTDLSKTTAQYTLYHRESNCVLITVENTSSREGKSGIDLTRAKLDSLTLISGHNNEENYSEKVGYEIDDYKNAPLDNRRWEVYLQAGHRFTWVLAAKETYNESNIRSWGIS